MCTNFKPGFHYDIHCKHKHNGGENDKHDHLQLYAWAEWIITLFSGPYVLDTVKQDDDAFGFARSSAISLMA